MLADALSVFEALRALCESISELEEPAHDGALEAELEVTAAHRRTHARTLPPRATRSACALNLTCACKPCPPVQRNTQHTNTRAHTRSHARTLGSVSLCWARHAAIGHSERDALQHAAPFGPIATVAPQELKMQPEETVSTHEVERMHAWVDICTRTHVETRTRM
jgi:hypothetical protein